MYSLRLLLRKAIKVSGAASIATGPTRPDEKFQLKRALVVSKLSRYEYEQQVNKNLSEKQLEDLLRGRGSNFDLLLHHHRMHKDFEQRITSIFKEHGIETQVVNRFSYTEKHVEWADIVVSAGGDGTFLLAASRIRNNVTPVVGFNSDPVRSEGWMSVPKKYANDMKNTILRLKHGKFQWAFRSRIRITLCGERIFDPPVELHEPDLLEPCHMFFHEAEREEVEVVSGTPTRCLPILALNEVFVSENLAARVSYFEIRLDGGISTSVKCSGICVCTGTGSSSWHCSMNTISQQDIDKIFHLLDAEGVRVGDPGLPTKVREKYNADVKFSPDDSRMAYTIRDIIEGNVWPNPKGILPRNFVLNCDVKSRCFDGSLVVDGTVAFSFNDGTCAKLQILPQDSLRTVRFD